MVEEVRIVFDAWVEATAKDPDAWEAFKARYLDVSEAEYQEAVKSR